MERYSLEKAQEEAERLRAKMKFDEAQTYQGTEQIVEREEIEKELSPEIIKKVMEKVQDINSSGTAYSVIMLGYNYDIKGNLTETERLSKLEQILQQGLLGGVNPEIDKSAMAREWAERREGWAKGKSKKGKRFVKPNFFNIVGRSHDISRKEGLEIEKSHWVKYNLDKFIIIFDISSFKEDRPGNPYGPYQSKTFKAGGLKGHDLGKFWEENFGNLKPGDPKVIEKQRESKLDYHLSKEGKPTVDTEYGFTTHSRIPPRLFLGVVFGLSRKRTKEEVKQELEKGKRRWGRAWGGDENERSQIEKELVEDMSPENLEQRANDILKIMKQAYAGREQLLVPIYDIRGNLWWPQKMNYEEIKQFVAEK